MICRNCGAKNNERRKRCFNCGEYFDLPANVDEPVLDTAEDKTVKQSTIPSYSFSEIDEGAEDNVLTDYTQNDIVEINEPIKEFSTDDSLQLEPIEFDGASFEQAGKADIDAIQFEEYSQNDDEYEGSYQNGEQYDADDDDDLRHASSKKNITIATLIWILVVIFIIILFALGVLLFKYFTADNDTYQAPTVNSVVELNLKQPIVMKGVDDKNEEYISATFYGQAGDRIYLECNGKSYTFIEDTLVLPNLYLSDLFSSEYKFKETDSTVSVNLNAYLIRDNKRYACNVEPFIMSVPPAELELKAPLIEGSETDKKVYSDSYTIHLWTGTDARVTLNNSDLTSEMDGLGNIKHVISVKPDSLEIYQLEVTQPYHTPIKKLFTISRDKLEMTLTIATTNASVISDSKITISGNTDQKATITSNLPILSQTFNELYNTYTVELDLSSCGYGQIEAIITATGVDGKTSSLSHTFWHWPDETAITTKSGKFTASVVNNPAKYAKNNYVITSAKATRVISSNEFEATVTLDGKDYTIFVTNEYEKSANVIIGNSYKIFAECEGYSDTGYPLFRGWYIYTAK